MVGAGPFRGYCIFDNHEEADAYPIYRDPIHDFGFLKFDPQGVKHMRIASLELHPELAKVGVEVRVVGNDAGEKLSILSGVISRLDRNAPDYGSGYNDFNTCYYQASAGASGGSSGSPVVNINGSVLALNSGRKVGAATGYMLPLDRPLRALRCLQEGRPIDRGDIQCQFAFKPFDECKRLGLSPKWEAQVRQAFPKGTNMLVASRVLPGGPSHDKIEEGDVLLKLNGEFVNDFFVLDEMLDANVGASIALLLSRGGTEIEAEILVGDLHKITPDRFLQLAGATFHDLSYQLARRYRVPCRGLYVASCAGSFWSLTGSENIIEAVDGIDTPDLDTFTRVMKDIPDRARIVVTYKSLHDLHTLKTVVVYVDRHWSRDMRLAVRNDKTGLWDFTIVADPLPPVPLVPRMAAFTTLRHVPSPEIASLVQSFVQVEFTAATSSIVDGFPQGLRKGAGLVVDADKGLVVAARSIVPFDFCDISITIGGSVVVEGEIVFLHPLHNYAVIRYDPALVDAPVLSATLNCDAIFPGVSTYFIGYKQADQIVHAATTVTEVLPFTIPTDSYAPRYRTANVETVDIDTNLGKQCSSGVLLGNDGRVRALWLTFMGEQPKSGADCKEYRRGLPVSTISEVVSQIRGGAVPKLRMLPAEFRPIEPIQARLMGVSEDWISKVLLAGSSYHRLFKAERRFEFGEQNHTLLEGDVILELNGSLVTGLAELNDMYSLGSLDAVIVRRREERSLQLTTVATEDVETSRVVTFCGATIQRPHLGLRQRLRELFSEVYISRYATGSPAKQYGMYPTNFITHLNGEPTPNLDSLLAVLTQVPDNECMFTFLPLLPSAILTWQNLDFRVKTVSCDGVRKMVTIKKDLHYFPTVEWVKGPTGWHRIKHEGCVDS